VNNWRKTIGIEEKLHVISRLEKGEPMVDIRRNIRLTHSSVHTIRDNADWIKESARSGTKVFVCVARLPQSYLNEPYQKTMDASLLHFYCIRNNILYRNVCTLYTNVYILYTQYTYTLQVCMSTSSIVIHYIGCSRQSPNPKKYTVLNGNFVFDLHNIFQECKRGVKRELPAYTILIQGISTTFIDQMPTYLV
jgi:hypothetical protein